MLAGLKTCLLCFHRSESACKSHTSSL